MSDVSPYIAGLRQIAPEVLLGQAHEPAADLFAVGVMLAVTLLGPPAGVFAAGGTGEFFSLRPGEVGEVVSAAVAEVKGRVPVIELMMRTPLVQKRGRR